MGTVLQERTRHSDHTHLPACNNRAKRKTPGSVSSRRNTNADVLQTEEKATLSMANRLHAPEMRTISTAVVIHPREMLRNPKNKVSSITNNLLERRCRLNRRQSGEKVTVPSRLPPVPAPRTESSERVTHEDMDSGSDLSDTERLPQSASSAEPPVLHLREEVIDPSDFQPSRAPFRSRPSSRNSYPDFLPPPFNSWGLRELAIYLNTDGKNIPRTRPVNQFERYLDRLLQLEWRQLLTLHDENSKSMWIVRRRPHSSLSAPKSILQCQRAFPFTLLSSVNPQICNRYSGPVCTYPHNSHLGTEKSRLPKRSSSETRAQRLNRLSDSSLDHLKRMQAIGNIRNPSAHNPHVNVPTSVDALRRKISGRRSRSCGDESKDGFRRVRSERGTEAHPVTDSNSSGSTGSEKEQVVGMTAAKHKHVEFVFHEQQMT